MPKKVSVGVVTSDKMDKTRRVEINRLVPHPVYGKRIRRRTVCIVHDEENESRRGDTVEIIEGRPRSKTKRWELVKVVSRSVEVDLAARRARMASNIDEPAPEPTLTGEGLVDESTGQGIGGASPEPDAGESQQNES